MRWKLSKKLLNRKSTKLQSIENIKRFQALKYVTTIPSCQYFEKGYRIVTLATPWKTWTWRYKLKSLSPKEILSDGFDGQPEIIAEYFR